MVKRRGGLQIYKIRGSLACVASGIFFPVVGKVRDSAARKLNRGRKRKLCKAGSGFESRQACFFFSSLSFPNYLSCVFNCNDLLGRSIISSPRSSTEVIVVFFLSNLLLFDVLHLLFIRQYMVMIGCTQKQWVCVCVCVCFCCSAMAVRIRAFQAYFTIGEIFMR